MPTVNRFFEDIKYVGLFFRLIGVLPIIKVKKNNKILLQPNSSDWIYLVGFMALYLIVFSYNILIMVNEELHINLRKDCVLAYMFIFALSPLCSIATIFWNREKLVNYFTKIFLISSQCEKIGIKIDFNTLKQKIYMCFALLLSTFIMKTLLTFTLPNVLIVQKIASVSLILKSALFFKTLLVSFILDEYIVAIKKHLFHNEVVEENVENTKYIMKQIRVTCQSHLKMHILGVKIKDSIELPLLLTIILLYAHCILLSYIVYLIASVEETRMNNIYTLLVLIILVAYEVFEGGGSIRRIADTVNMVKT